MKDKKAQAGGIVTYISLIFLFALIYLALGVVMDELIVFSNEFMTKFSWSQAHQTSMGHLFQLWYIIPVLIILAFMIVIIRNAIKRKGAY